MNISFLGSLFCFLCLILANCSSVDTLRTQLQKGELRGTIAVTKPVSYGPDHQPLNEQGGAFPVYFAQALAKEGRILNALSVDDSLPVDASPAQAQRLGRKAGADWVLQTVLLGDRADVRHRVEHFVDPAIYFYPVRQRGFRRYHPVYYHPAEAQAEATTSTVRSASLSLKLYRVSDGAEMWLGQGSDSVSNSRSVRTWGGFVTLPSAPSSPELAEALAEMAEDSAKELAKFAPKSP